MLNTRQCVIDWLIRLPLLSVLDLSTLLYMPEREAAWTVLELEKLGWVEGVRPSSPEIEDDLLYLLSAAGAARLAEVNGSIDLQHVVPIARSDIRRRLASLEITVGVNRFLVELKCATCATASSSSRTRSGCPSRRRLSYVGGLRA